MEHRSHAVSSSKFQVPGSDSDLGDSFMPETPIPPPPRRPRLAQRLRLPVVSGKWTVLWLVCCFALTGVFIPLVLHLPKWIDFEIVVAVWWFLWALILVKLLYKGEQVSDDHQHHEPRDWFGLNNTSLSGCGDAGCALGADAEGCLVVLGLIAALVLVWVLVEFAIPIVFLLLYFLVRGMLAHVVNERPSCQGNFGLSAIRGIFWATVYSAPLAGAVWIIHWIYLKRM